jgi:hypothetical protein
MSWHPRAARAGTVAAARGHRATVSHAFIQFTPIEYASRAGRCGVDAFFAVRRSADCTRQALTPAGPDHIQSTTDVKTCRVIAIQARYRRNKHESIGPEFFRTIYPYF